QTAGFERVSLSNLNPSVVLKTGETLQQAPFRSSPFRSSPFRSSPFRSSPFRSSPLALALPGTVLLSEIPLVEPKTWPDVLRGTSLQNVPLQAITLADVLRVNPPNLFMGDVDLDETPLREVPLAALLLSPLTVG